MNETARTMVFAAFTADALALGAHWIYDTRRIDETFGRIRDFQKPQPPTYHPARERGELTHYGDQTLVLLSSIAECGGFDASAFSRAWQELFRTYDGYIDGATRGTLANLAAGSRPTAAGSSSADLAGAARIAPLVYAYRDDPERLVEAARHQTALTHNHPQVIAAAEFFARAAQHALHGVPARQALERAADEAPLPAEMLEWVDLGLRSTGDDTRSSILGFGQMCEIAAAFPATVHLVATYENRLEEGLIENVMAGGDSAGRGLVTGMLLGAGGGPAALPRRWREELRAGEMIEGLLRRIDESISSLRGRGSAA
ncbi:MAG: ADP-ribosylglycohydrolase family protein [Desulfobacterales bacterium]|nr:ADP-ribosylglycohydrolase family protein [Desulfobacterales bacterium]